MPYSVGLPGPAGGCVFYDKGYYSDGWRYLEAAPYDIYLNNVTPTVGTTSNRSSIIFGYYRPDGTTSTMVGTSTVVGAGKENTTKLVEAMGDQAYSSSSGNSTTSLYAARACSLLEYGGYDDWFLPSKDELCETYKALKCPGGTNHGSSCPDKTHEATSTETTRGSFGNDVYWTSSEFGANSVWPQNFNYGTQNYSIDSRGKWG